MENRHVPAALALTTHFSLPLLLPTCIIPMSLFPNGFPVVVSKIFTAQRFRTPLSEGPCPTATAILPVVCLAKNRETTPGGNDR